jgi:serine/threonine-protein kinase
VTKESLFVVPFDLSRLEVTGAPTRLEEVSTDTSRGFAQADFSQSGIFSFRTGGSKGVGSICWLDRAGKTQALDLEAARYTYPRLSPDGTRLAYVITQGSNSDLWIYDWQRNAKTRLTNGRVTRDPIWGPDGRFVVFESVDGMVFVQADGAGAVQQLTQTKNRQLPNSFTADGKELVFSELRPGAKAEIRVLPVEIGAGKLTAGEPRSLFKTSSISTFASISPDGRWLAYANADGGPYEIYVRAFPDRGTQVQVSNSGGTMPYWSRNGQELFYRTEDQRIMVANYTVKGESFIPDKPRVWVSKQISNVGLAANLDLAPDGKHFIVLMPAESTKLGEKQSHVTLIVNFFDEVRRRVAAQNK